MSTSEKPWGGGWGGTQSGTRPVDGKNRRWFHLWKINENAIRASASPSVLHALVTDSSFSGVATDEGGSTPTPNDVQPKWEEITSGTGSYLVRATVIVGGASLTGTQTPADIVINDITEVEWLPSEAKTENGVNLAKLEKHGKHGWRTFPEKTDADRPNNPTPIFNMVEIGIKLAIIIPDEMTATVHLARFDPNNPIGQKPPANTTNGQGVRDNTGNLNWAHNTNNSVIFNAKDDYQTKVCIISPAHAGDNHIVAAHPNTGTLGQYRFQDDGKTLTRPSGNNRVVLKKELHTDILTVWRTLWLELKQMAAPEIGTGKDFDPKDKGNNNGQWNDSAPVDEPHDFDVNFQPPLPDISKTVEQFARACIDVQPVSVDQIKRWSGKNGDTTPKFTKNLNSQGVTNTLVGRDVPTSANVNAFWVIHALGAYDPASNKDFDSGYNWEAGYATRLSALIYNELIRDLIATYRWPDPWTGPGPRPAWFTPGGRPHWVAIDEARARIMLHETLHYFLGLHTTSPEADRGIMNTSLLSPDCPLYVGGIYELDDGQIRLIQKQPKPAQNG
jgi:hypothetical protein